VTSVADLLAVDGPLTVRELASVLRCSRGFVVKQIYAGTIRAGKIGSDWRIPHGEAIRIAVELRLIQEPQAAQALPAKPSR
jgi:excisionase family DNA binding protein